MANLKVNVAGVEFPNPVIVGCPSFYGLDRRQERH